MRRQKRRPLLPLLTRDSGSFESHPADILVQARDGSPSQALQRLELAAVVRQALEGLNERQRMAVLLNKFEDMNYAEIGAVMSLSPKAVKSLLNRARTNLRSILASYVNMDGEPLPIPSKEDL